MKAVLQRVALAVSLAWVVILTLMFLVMLQNQAHDEQNGAFQGRYIGMAIEGLSVLQQELSRTNIEISILKQAKEKTELPDPFPIRLKGT